MPKSTMVKTQVSTRTKVVVTVAAIFALGLAAYGFGFVPISFQEAEPEQKITCEEQCGASYDVCSGSAEDTGACPKKYEACLNACKQPLPAEMPCEDRCQREFCPSSLAADVICDEFKMNSCIDECRRTEPFEKRENGKTDAAIVPKVSACAVSVMQITEPSVDVAVAGGIAWKEFGRFRVSAEGEDVVIDRVNVSSRGDASSFSRVGIASEEGVLQGDAVLPDGINGNADVAFERPWTVPRDGSVVMRLWGRLAPVVSRIGSPTSASEEGARSGDIVRLGLNANPTGGEWDSRYYGKYNLSARCAGSSDRVYADGAETLGSSMVIRKTQPVISARPVPSLVLPSSTSSVELYRFSASADAAGPVGLRKMTFIVTQTPAETPLQFGRFRLKRGSQDMASADVRITDGEGNDLENGLLRLSSGRATVVVTFVDEETIVGSGHVYALRAMGSGARSGDAISIRLARDLSGEPVTGYLSATGTAPGERDPVGPHIDTGESASNAVSRQGSFVWSDFSETPHSAANGVSGGSRDWTTDAWLDLPDVIRTFSR